jgi:uncharacterized protein YbjT (DUF2867 family)
VSRYRQILLFAVLAASVPLTAPAADQARMEQTLALVQKWVAGRYDNSAQVDADVASEVPDELKHRLMHQIFVPTDAPQIPGYLVFQQSSADGSTNPDMIIRVGLLQFFADAESGTIRQRELHFKEPEEFHNAHLTPERLATVTLDDFEADPGCDFYLLADELGERVVGPIGERSCRIFSAGINKELVADDEVVITPDEYWFLGRFVDENGAVVWGNASDEHVQMRRVESVEQLMRPAGGVLIFGATRNTGLHLAKLLTARGDKVTAFVRPTSDRSGLEPLGVRFVVGDALNADEVTAAFESARYSAVVTTIGCFKCDPKPDYLGNKNVFDAAKASGVSRVIMISTVGAGDSADAPPWLSKWFLKDVIKLKTQAEDYLMDLGLDYTIIRPGGLKDAEPTGNGMLSEDRDTMGIITRADLAGLMLDCLDDPDTARRVYAAVDSEMSWPWDMF